MNPQEKLQRLLKVKAAFPGGQTGTLMDTLVSDLPFTLEKNERAERGLASESRFADVFSALDWAVLIHGLDQWQLPLDSKSEWQVPDHLIFVRPPKREASPVLVETKLVSGQKATFEISLSQLELLERYAVVAGMPLVLAIFWQRLHLWTTHTPDQLTRKARVARLAFDDATRSDVSVIFADTLIVISPTWQRRTTYDPNAKGFHVRHPDRGFIVEDYLATDGSTFVKLTEVESGIINKIMRPKTLKVTKNGTRSIVLTASVTDGVAKASSIVHLLLEEFEAFGEESEPARAFGTLARLKRIAHLPIHAYLPTNNTTQVQRLFERTFGFAWSD